MSEILLVYPKTDFERNYKSYWLPYSILSVGSQIRNDGHNITLLDGHIDNLDDVNFQEYDILGISSMIGHQIKHSLNLSNLAKSRNPKLEVIMGGPFPTLAPDIANQSRDIDYIITGQGEIPFQKLLKAINNEINIENVPSLVTKKIITPRMKPVNRGDLEPFDFSLINVERYIQNEENINSRTLNYISSQGCLFNCGFCSDTNLYSGKYLSDELTRTISDIEYLIEEHGINGIKFYDSNFFMNPKRGLEFAKELIKKKIQIKWGGAIHPKTTLKYSTEDMRTLQESGLSRVLIGLESPNQEVLNLIGKGRHLKKEDLIEVVRKNKKFGIVGSYTMIVGFPSVPTEHANETLQFGRELRELDPNSEVKIHIYYPYPQTELYQLSIANGFRPMHSLDYYQNIDYYENQTPFSTSELEEKVRIFNQENSLSVKNGRN